MEAFQVQVNEYPTLIERLRGIAMNGLLLTATAHDRDGRRRGVNSLFPTDNQRTNWCALLGVALKSTFGFAPCLPVIELKGGINRMHRETPLNSRVVESREM